DIDVILYVVDATREIGDEEKAVGRIVREAQGKKILVINKIDSKQARSIDFYRDWTDKFDAVLEVSALRGTHLEKLREVIFDLLPEGEFFYPKGQLTNLTNEELIGELIREKVFLRLHEEVPYSTHVVVEEVEERADGTLYVKANIVTSEERHKGIIVGKGGRGIREVGQSARKDLETITGGKVFLDLMVEVDQHWVERI
ncbi:GTPase Era, partial [Candidatus Uhrbacteria bacterium RIFCSPHIGHO2_02_FULL_54_11]